MKIKMRTLAAGANGVMRPGEIHEVSHDVGTQLVAGGYAVRVDEPEAPAIETAAAPEEPVEVAVQSQPRPKPTKPGRERR